VENKTQIMQYVLQMQSTSSLPKHMKRISRGVFLRVFAYANVSHLKHKAMSICLKN